MRIGSAVNSIVPHELLPLSGYMGHRPSLGSHDSLNATVVIIDTHIFVSLDLIGIDDNLYRNIKRKLPDQYTITIFASHTHAGPVGTLDTSSVLHGMQNVFQDIDHTYLEFVTRQVLDAIDKSLSSMEPFEATFAEGAIENLWTHRINPQNTINNSLWFIEFKTSTKTTMMLSFPCHPTVLNNQNQLYSKDLLYGLDLAKDIDILLFMNGPSADISTRFTRQESSYSEIERMGHILWKQIIKLRSSAVPFTLNYIDVVDFYCDLKTKSQSSNHNLQIEQLQLAYKQSKNPHILTQLDGLILERSFLSSNPPSVIPIHLQIIGLENLRIVAIPAELSHAFTLENTKIVTLANGYLSYFTSCESFDQKTYESYASVIDRGEAERMIHFIENTMEAH
ncbi:hypothetical protein [Erysipelothrix anatis]|uniref:hypothetical protein n=1 Tax=Erysipelothrix anatis TaxID=2683713 RepID=UPI00135BE916|nr:hypothetical protein [Erysipelothrix anatis]